MINAFKAIVIIYLSAVGWFHTINTVSAWMNRRKKVDLPEPAVTWQELDLRQQVKALLALVQQHEAELAKAQETIAELKSNALIEEEQLLAVLPEDYGAVEYIKYLEGEQRRIPDLVHGLESAQATIATLRDSLQQQARELEEANTQANNRAIEEIHKVLKDHGIDEFTRASLQVAHEEGARLKWELDAAKAYILELNTRSNWARELEGASGEVLAERRRQVEAEGWTPEHDDEHDEGELAAAAAGYAYGSRHPDVYLESNPPGIWPWTRDWWKPSDQRRMLVKAGALILAEIERLDRHSARAQQAEAKKEEE